MYRRLYEIYFGETSSMNIYEEVASVACLILFRLWYKDLFLRLILFKQRK